MINLELKKNRDGDGSGHLLKIAGEMTLAHAAELKQALQELANAKGTLKVDCASVERIDLAGLQLLGSLVKSAAERQLGLLLDISQLPVVAAALKVAGFPADYCDFSATGAVEETR